MKFSESWLREWVNPKLTSAQLCEKFTMTGLEVEEAVPTAEKFSGVVVGQVVALAKHPQADRLQICEVDVGASKPLTIVCGASNVKHFMKVAAALDDAMLANHLTIKTTTVRGVTSQGMLCSARELGIVDANEGLFELPKDAPIGKNVWNYLKLNDRIIDLAITPNRGDCLSILGIAKEVSAFSNTPLKTATKIKIKAASKNALTIKIQAKEACPQYVGRVIRNVRTDAVTPVWLSERLRRSGVRSISPIVDVTNYVMLELGQPMHAFTLEKISGGINVRMAKAGEKIKLLDDSEVRLTTETLVIADFDQPLAIAGIMGGLDSSVTSETQNIFLESAFFTPAAIARGRKVYGLNSDSAYRFERGIDPLIQQQGIERATQLLLEIVGGIPGSVTAVTANKYLPQPATITLRASRIEKMLGCNIPTKQVEKILQRLGFSCKKNTSGWRVIVPARRSDITQEIDLIEELARLYGYDNIPCHQSKATLKIHSNTETKIPLALWRRALSDLGYQEVITYSFIDKKLPEIFTPTLTAKELLNPLSADMGVMRTSLWPGLINTLLYNQNRQQTRIRIFESGLRFIVADQKLLQESVLAGLVTGPAWPEQWGIPNKAVDFFDLKGDLQNLFKLTDAEQEFTFKPGKHAALHPGQTVEIYRNGEYLGILGLLHPGIAQALKIEGKIFLFELMLAKLDPAWVPRFSEVSKFPEIRRDLAVLLDQSIPAQEIQDTIRDAAGELLKDIDIFDVYQGKGIPPGQKSLALALTLQHASRTLVDEEVGELVERVLRALKKQFNAELRG